MLIRLLALLLIAPATAAAPSRPYEVDYHARFEPADGHVEASIEVIQAAGELSLLDFNAPDPRFSDFRGDGAVRRDDDRVIWEVPEDGGKLRYRVLVDNQREDGEYDARLTEDWAVLRLGDLFPPARVRSRAGAFSRARLSVAGPEGWSFETRYGPVREAVGIDTSDRRFDRPTGWMAAGELGTRRAHIAGRRIAVTGPREQGFRRLDVLTFLNWTLPELTRVAPSFPARAVIVGAGDAMWRGALSGPGSFYMHTERPLVSGNATSTLLHELMHVATEEPAAEGDDWIVEGLAEYYSLNILRRSGGISEARYQRALEMLRRWAKRDDGRLADPSSGADTARAVLLFEALAAELGEQDESLDPIAGAILGGEEPSRERLAALLEETLGEPSAVLAEALAAQTASSEAE